MQSSVSSSPSRTASSWSSMTKYFPKSASWALIRSKAFKHSHRRWSVQGQGGGVRLVMWRHRKAFGKEPNGRVRGVVDDWKVKVGAVVVGADNGVPEEEERA